MKNKQKNLFNFQDEDTTKTNKTKSEKKVIKIDYSEVPTMDLENLLEQMQVLITNGIIKQTDKYFRLELSFKPYVTKLEDSLFVVIALAWSDSAVYNFVFENEIWKTTEEYLNICDSKGAYTKRAWSLFNEDRSIAPNDFMELFKIKEHLRPMIFATGTKEECENAFNILVEWNRNHIKPLSQLQDNPIFNFIKISRRKGEIESTRCMNGECIGGILTRENAF